MNIYCSGPHNLGTAPVLGTSDKPQTGLLCSWCGQTYVVAVAGQYVSPKTIPNKALLTTILPLVAPNAVTLLAGYR